MQFRWWSLFYFILRCFVSPKCGICALFSPFLAWSVIKCGFIFILPGKVKQFDENFHLKSNISDEKQSKMLSNKNKNVAISKWNAAIANTKPYHFNEHPFSSGNSFVSSFVFFSSFSFAFSVLRFATPQCRLLIVWLHLLFEFAVSQTEQNTRWFITDCNHWIDDWNEYTV